MFLGRRNIYAAAAAAAAQVTPFYRRALALFYDADDQDHEDVDQSQ